MGTEWAVPGFSQVLLFSKIGYEVIFYVYWMRDCSDYSVWCGWVR